MIVCDHFLIINYDFGLIYLEGRMLQWLMPAPRGPRVPGSDTPILSIPPQKRAAPFVGGGKEKPSGEAEPEKNQPC